MGIRIVQTNPQPVPEHVPGYRSNVKFHSSGRTVARYETHATTRTVQDLSGDLLIVEASQPQNRTSSIFDLPAPKVRTDFEQAQEGFELRIINATQFKHAVHTPPDVINGKFSTILLDGVGACVTLYASAGRWLAIGANAKVRIS